MAKQTVVVSDISGRVVTEPARIVVTTNGKQFVLDADATEELVVEIVSHAHEQKKRGRKPKAVAA